MVELQRKGVGRRKGKRIFIVCIIGILIILIYALVIKNSSIQIEIESIQFTESSRKLSNPNRGFYHLYTFWITEEQTDYEEVIENINQDDRDTDLILIKVCLQNYRDGRISEKGIWNIESLFNALEFLDKQMIVRFIYDDEGKGKEYEPESMDIILQHMRQLKPILDRHSKKIFILQGVFTGNWGEMNGTRYNTAENTRRLAGQLESVTDDSIYLAVRTPAQWRSIIQSDDPSEETLSGSSLSARLGLFNDGLLGNWSDYGTYKPEDNDSIDSIGRWNREEELDFQEVLCRYVPNGGEVINDNLYNDFENAVEGLEERHITYLNKDYDPSVLKKWEKDIVTEQGCFYGMDGYSYIERRLGYRLLIAGTCLTYNKERQCVSVEVSLKNVGFAPLYKEPEISVVLYNESDGEVLSKEMSCAVRELSGGKESDMLRTASVQISVNELSKTEYSVFFLMEDPDTQRHILLANEEEEEEYGYRIGAMKLY